MKNKTFDWFFPSFCEKEKISDYVFVGSNYKEMNTIGITITDSNEGVQVTEVKNTSIAFDIDIKPGDILLNIGGRKVNNSFDVSFLLNIYDKYKNYLICQCPC